MSIIKNNILKLFFKLGEYVLFIGCACLIIYYLFNMFIGSPNEIKDTSSKIDLLDDKIDTTIGLQGYVIDRITVIESNQGQIYDAIIENNKLLKQTNKEILNLKKQVKETNNKNIELERYLKTKLSR